MLLSSTRTNLSFIVPVSHLLSDPRAAEVRTVAAPTCARLAHICTALTERYSSLLELLHFAADAAAGAVVPVLAVDAHLLLSLIPPSCRTYSHLV